MKRSKLVGKKIRLVETGGAVSHKGDVGVVLSVDDCGYFKGTWGDYPVIPGLDRFEVLEEE